MQKLLRYHDTGKLYTKEFRNYRGEPTETAHFYGHENYSAYLYLTEMCCGRDVSGEEFRTILYETSLINCHMRPLNVWKGSASAKEKDLKLFGKPFMEDLEAVHRADRAAH